VRGITLILGRSRRLWEHARSWRRSTFVSMRCQTLTLCGLSLSFGVRLPVWCVGLKRFRQCKERERGITRSICGPN